MEVEALRSHLCQSNYSPSTFLVNLFYSKDIAFEYIQFVIEPTICNVEMCVFQMSQSAFCMKSHDFIHRNRIIPGRIRENFYFKVFGHLSILSFGGFRFKFP